MSQAKEKGKTRLALQITLTTASILWLAFIFSNSLRTGTASSTQSSKAVRLVQTVAGWFAPDGWIATAEGKDYLRLHNFVRKAAHFIEFAVLGGLLCWCYCSYTLRLRFAFLPIAGTLVVPIVDELLQTLVDGRAGTLTDVLIDVSGGLTGLFLAALVVWIIVKIYRKRQAKEKEE